LGVVLTQVCPTVAPSETVISDGATAVCSLKAPDRLPDRCETVRRSHSHQC